MVKLIKHTYACSVLFIGHESYHISFARLVTIPCLLLARPPVGQEIEFTLQDTAARQLAFGILFVGSVGFVRSTLYRPN